MPARWYLVGSLAIMGLGLAPGGLVHAAPAAAGGAVALRYHFVAGQRFAYRMNSLMQVSFSVDGAAAATAPGDVALTMSGVITYHILHVDATGGAEAEFSQGKLTLKTTTGGKTTTSTLKAQPAQVVYLSADGSQRGAANSARGSYALQALAALPAVPVAPGAQWTSAGAVGLPSMLGAALPPLNLTAHYRFANYTPAHGQRAARIDSTGTTEYVTDTTFSGAPVHLHLSATVQGQSLFGLTVRRPVDNQAHIDMRVFVSGRATTGAAMAMREHVVMHVTLRPQGW